VSLGEKSKKALKTRFYPKNVCKYDKKPTLFLLPFDVQPVD